MTDEIVIPDGDNPSEEHPVVVTELFSGPVPHPWVLERYKAVDSEFPMLLMRMAVEEQEHRHYIDRKKIDVVERKIENQAAVQQGDLKFGTRGQWLAFSLAVVFLAALVFFGYLGMETAICWGFGTGGFIVVFRFLSPRFFAHDQKDKEKS